MKQTQSYLYVLAAERLKQDMATSATYKKMGSTLEKNKARVYPDVGLFLVLWKCNVVNARTKTKEKSRPLSNAICSRRTRRR